MSTPTISPRQFYEKNHGEPLIDVRTPAEFREVHANAARNVPLDVLDAEQLLAEAGSSRPIYLICKSGSRARTAAQRFAKYDENQVCCIEGGTEAWIADDLPVVRGKATISLERQVRIAAGSLVIVGALLALIWNSWWVLLPAFVGSGLVFAGVTDTCGMAMILTKMPWNRVHERCQS